MLEMNIEGEQVHEPPTVETGSEATPPSETLSGRRVVARLLGRVPGLRATSVTNRLTLAVHGSAWTLAGIGASQFLKLASTLVLARILLDPKAFGLMALVNVFLTGLEVLSDLGIGLDIVQHPRGEDPLFLDTAFLIQVARSSFLCLIAVGLAVPFAAFYNQREVRLLVMVGSLSTGIRGFASMSVWLMMRAVNLAKLTKLTVIGDAAGLVVSVACALASPTAWALVWGKVASAVVYVIASHVVADRMPQLRWDRRAAREILIFGSGIVLSSATYFISSQSERLVVGKFATASELGCFSLALSMAYAPYIILQKVTSNVFFPMISAVARDAQPSDNYHTR